MDTEIIATSKVKEALARTDYLVPKIPEEDTGISWDGEIFVYNKPVNGNKHKKEDLMGIAPVQVKGHEINNYPNVLSYTVSISDIKNFLLKDGTIFFVVCFNRVSTATQIYYYSFLPYDIKELLKHNNHKKSKSLKFRKFPDSSEVITSLLFSFVDNMQKQRSYITVENVSYNELIAKQNVCSLSFNLFNMQKRGNIFDALLESDTYLYANVDNGISFPIEHISDVLEVFTRKDKNICIDSKIYYTSYILSKKRDGTLTISFGKSFFIETPNNGISSSFQYKLKGVLSERIQDLTFLVAVIENKGFSIADHYFPINLTNCKINIEENIKALESLTKLKVALEKIDAIPDIDIDEIADNEVPILDALIITLVDGESLKLKNNIDTPYNNIKIGKKHYLISILANEEHRYNIYNFFDAPTSYKMIYDNAVEKIIPPALLLDKECFTTFSNLPSEKIICQIKNVNNYDELTEEIILLLLQIINAYDDSKVSRLLELSSEISKIIQERDHITDKRILTINNLQVEKRKRPLTNTEKLELLRITDNSSDNPFLLISANILLEEYNEAEAILEKLSNVQKDEFITFPIYHLMKESG